MKQKLFMKLSWGLWLLFMISAVLILVANFIFQLLVKDNQKLTTAMNALFIILNVIIFAYLIFVMLINVYGKQIDCRNVYHLLLWSSFALYTIMGISSSIAILNPSFYTLKAVTTMLSFIAALVLFPSLTINLIKQAPQKRLDWLISVLLIMYLSINLLLNFVIFLDLNDVVAFLVTVTTLNLVVSVIFFALLTKKSVLLYQNKHSQIIMA